VETPGAVFKISVLASQRSLLGEAPFHDSVSNVLYYVDSLNGDFLQLNLTSGNESKIHVGGSATIMIPYQNNPQNFLVTYDNQILKLNWETQETELIVRIPDNEEGTEKFNDGKCDKTGRLLIGSVTTNISYGGTVPNASALYRLDGNSLVKLVGGISVSNGMGWSNDEEQKNFYLNDFGKRIIYQFDYNLEDGALCKQ